ncbi:hypothetical protein [Rhodopila sp.]|uniref:hypothetical protein n=1 Tax=Rhodopila sp. TaxID=2480087 RepID=UPI003D0A0EAD
MKWLVAGAAVCLLAMGTANAQPPPPPTYAPIPPPRAEVVPPPPGGRMIWEPGHWQWDGARYAWHPGRYVERGPHHGHYVQGRWIWGPREHRWLWRPAHWG